MIVGFGDCLNSSEAEACPAQEECTTASPTGVDDSEGELQSLLVLDLAMGQQISIVVDAFDTDETGDITLTINDVPADTDGGSCCADDGGAPGCDVPEVQTCVCMFDVSCCEMLRDAACVEQAVGPKPALQPRCAPGRLQEAPNL